MIHDLNGHRVKKVSGGLYIIDRKVVYLQQKKIRKYNDTVIVYIMVVALLKIEKVVRYVAV